VGDLTAVLQALGDPVRMRIVRSLADADVERSCGSFAIPLTKSTMSHHFRVLREAGIIGHRSEGTRRLISLRREELDAAYPGLIDSVLLAAGKQAVGQGQIPMYARRTPGSLRSSPAAPESTTRPFSST
jgi:DNA-binding transcriptional ArsR family regulator